MNRRVTLELVALLALLSVSAPAFAGHGDEERKEQRHEEKATEKQAEKQVVREEVRHDERAGERHAAGIDAREAHTEAKQAEHQAERNANFGRREANQAAKWEWHKHNWNEQRDYMHTNWAAREAALDEAQKQQLNEQLKAQWLAYHNNNWKGEYSWNQYSDPAFLDYIHRKNPSLLTTIRNVVGF